MTVQCLSGIRIPSQAVVGLAEPRAMQARLPDNSGLKLHACFFDKFLNVQYFIRAQDRVKTTKRFYNFCIGSAQPMLANKDKTSTRNYVLFRFLGF
jgi:hypothetical protein